MVFQRGFQLPALPPGTETVEVNGVDYRVRTVHVDQHGGVLMSLADSAGALVTFLGLPEGKTTATITSTSHMFRPVTGGTVRAVAVPVHRGRTTVTAQTSVYDAAERLVAQTTQVQAIR